MQRNSNNTATIVGRGNSTHTTNKKILRLADGG